MNTYNYEDLIHYYKESKTYSQEEYYVNYYKALSNSFGIDFNEEHSRNVKHRLLWDMLKESLDNSKYSISPFSGIQEASKEFVDYFKTDMRTFGEISQNYFKAHLDMQLRIIETIYGKLEKEITSEDLLKYGFDDTQEPPDLWEYY